MPVGWLQASVVLDRPGFVHCGSQEPVTGQVRLKYNLHQRTELFGPLRVAVLFHGRAKTKIVKSSGNSSTTYRGRAPLFERSLLIYDDAIKFQPGEVRSFPFAVYFPDRVDPPSLAASWEHSDIFDVDPTQPLPPSCSFEGRHFGRFEAFVEYRVGCQVRMPRIDVTISTPDKYAEPMVPYKKPSPLAAVPPCPFEFRACVSVQNEQLVPPQDRAQGFRQRAKAALSSDYYPRYSFDWFCTAPRQLQVGQPAVFEIRVKPRENENAALVVPDISISDFMVIVNVDKVVRPERGLIRNPQSSSSSLIASLRGTPENGTPFGKANDWTKRVNIRQLNNMTSTFGTFNIAITHRMEIRIAFSVAGKIKEATREFPVTVLAPLQENKPATSLSLHASTVAPQAGSSTWPGSFNGMGSAPVEHEYPPAYQEALPGEDVPASEFWEDKMQVTNANLVSPSLR